MWRDVWKMNKIEVFRLRTNQTANQPLQHRRPAYRYHRPIDWADQWQPYECNIWYQLHLRLSVSIQVRHQKANVSSTTVAIREVKQQEYREQRRRAILWRSTTGSYHSAARSSDEQLLEGEKIQFWAYQWTKEKWELILNWCQRTQWFCVCISLVPATRQYN